MDPRKAAIITAQSLKDAFVQGAEEARADDSAELMYVVSFYFKGTKLRDKAWSDPVDALKAVAEHLAHGEGSRCDIVVSSVASDADVPAELPAGA